MAEPPVAPTTEAPAPDPPGKTYLRVRLRRDGSRAVYEERRPSTAKKYTRLLDRERILAELPEIRRAMGEALEAAPRDVRPGATTPEACAAKTAISEAAVRLHYTPTALSQELMALLLSATGLA